jgi:hypothetical protein
MDPVENAWRWMRWTATGPESAISEVFRILDANLPSGWRRLTEDELHRYGGLVKPGSGWYGLEAIPPEAGIVLGIERPVPSLMTGGRVWLPGPPSPTATNGVPAAWDDVGRFFDEGIVPAVKAAGASLRAPTSEEVFFSELPFDARERLRTFSDAAGKTFPLNSEEAELWRDFVIAAFRTNASIDTQPFINWLSAAGWPRGAAAELYSHLLDQWHFLARYVDEVSTT